MPRKLTITSYGFLPGTRIKNYAFPHPDKPQQLSIYWKDVPEAAIAGFVPCLPDRGGTCVEVERRGFDAKGQT